MQATARFYGTGRRKCSVARVWLQAGDGKIQVNERSLDDFFPRPSLKMVLAQPFKVAGLEGKVDVVMGTFSKSFGVIGGFVSSSKPIAEYLRYMARSHMFSASLPPIVVAAVLAGLDVMVSEPDRLANLHSNIRYANREFSRRGFPVQSSPPIIPLRVPVWMNIRDAALRFHESGIFVNAVEYPAVPVRQQRFRISLTSDHTKNDIDRLVECAGTVWAACAEKACVDEPAAAG